MRPLTKLLHPLGGGLKLKRIPQQNLRSLHQPNLNDPKDALKRPSHLQSMREFFMHPATWDRNNGYFNVVLALAIFGFCFFSSCTPCESRSEMEAKPPRQQ